MFPKSEAYCLEPRILVCSLPHLCINLLSQDPFCLIRPFKGVIISDLDVLIYLIWSFFTKNFFNSSFFYVLQENLPPPLVHLLICFFMYDKLFWAYVKCLMYFQSHCFSWKMDIHPWLGICGLLRFKVEVFGSDLIFISLDVWSTHQWPISHSTALNTDWRGSEIPWGLKIAKPHAEIRIYI